MAATVAEQSEDKMAPQEKMSWRNRLEKISYNSIVNNVPYLLFIALLCVLYIANTSRAVSLIREITKKKQEVKELRWQYLDIQSRLMKATSETELINRAAALGLKPLDKPAYEITIKDTTATVKK